MKKLLIISILNLLFVIQLKAQTPQIVVVRPNGVSSVFTTWDLAYAAAVDGDNIYLPGTTLANASYTFNIDKILNIFGTGHYPDSTNATGKTFVNHTINISKKVHHEGFETSGINITNSLANGSSFIKLKFSTINFGNSESHFVNSCVFHSVTGGGGIGCSHSKNILISNSILTAFSYIKDCSFENCIFLASLQNWQPVNCANTTFKNNIFFGILVIDWYYAPSCYPLTGNTFYNNAFTQGVLSNVAEANNIININPNETFHSNLQSVSGNVFLYNFNFHLRINSPLLTSGINGTQIGIYGGTLPYIDGAVPSNPHIFFKQIAPQTNTDGKLNVRVKVRTTN